MRIMIAELSADDSELCFFRIEFLFHEIRIKILVVVALPDVEEAFATSVT